MSFEFGFCKAKKFKNISVKEFLEIDRYIEWELYERDLQDTDTFEEYWAEFFEGDYGHCNPINTVALEYYEGLDAGERYEFINTWETSEYFNDFIENKLNEISSFEYDGINEETIDLINAELENSIHAEEVEILDELKTCLANIKELLKDGYLVWYFRYYNY